MWARLTSSDLAAVTPAMLGLLTSAGPVLLAQLMANITDKTKRSIFYPFHKASVVELATNLRKDVTIIIRAFSLLKALKTF